MMLRPFDYFAKSCWTVVGCEAHYGKLAYVFYFQMWSLWYRQNCCNIKGSEVSHNHARFEVVAT